MTNYQSWGCYPKASPHHVEPIYWPQDLPNLNSWDRPVLPYGYGRSYGDSCLNNDGVLLSTRTMNRFLGFDRSTGILRCESGVSLQEILRLFVPKGWFLPVTPGTQMVSIGGAIANDVHGKNHHRAGTFGCHVYGVELLRSNGEHVYCSLSQHPEMFRATIGGLGLTGLILWAEIQLKPINGPWICAERIKFRTLEEFFSLSADSEPNFEYTVAWIDCLAPRRQLGRGIFIRGNHQNNPSPSRPFPFPGRTLQVPRTGPSSLLNAHTLKLFNALYFHSNPKIAPLHDEPYYSFFYPLDSLLNWNRLYGRKGLLQYQCVIPPTDQERGTHTLLKTIQQSGQGSFLAVLKQFGSHLSPGLLSFPKQGTTLALDFAFKGQSTLDLLNTLDAIVCEYGGAVYPAKDARMSPYHFQTFFPQWKDFLPFIDPKFSSSFWRRVTTPQDGTPTTEKNMHKESSDLPPIVDHLAESLVSQGQQ